MAKARALGTKWKVIGLVTLAAVTAGVTGLAVTRPLDSDAPSAVAPTSIIAPTALVPAVRTVVDVAPNLKQPGRRVVLAVFGDSTGNGPDEWVRLTVDAIVQQTGRTASLSTWSLITGKYDAPEIIGAGVPDLIVWNASASGKRPIYASENLAAMMPEKADIVIINHGHNNSNAIEARTQIGDLIGQLRSSASADAAIALTLQNPRLDKLKDGAALVVQGIRAQANLLPDVAVIDVNAAFARGGELAPLLLPDGLHPSPAGSQIWAQAVLKVLGF